MDGTDRETRKENERLLMGCDPAFLIGQYSKEHQEAAEEGAIFAMLSNNAYELGSRPHFNLPDNIQEINYTFDAEGTGLELRLYSRLKDEAIDEVFVAFKGTDGKTDKFNGNYFKGQYDVSDKVIEDILSKYPNANIVATGHSLGGGLALHASLIYKGVHAYVFNPSYRVHNSDNYNDNVRHSFQEKGDPLGFHRWLWKNPEQTKIWKYNFVRKKNHTSYSLARGLLMLAASGGKEQFTELLAKNCNL